MDLSLEKLTAWGKALGMDPNIKCVACGAGAGRKLCQTCKDTPVFETECWELDRKVPLEQRNIEGKSCYGCGTDLESATGAYEVRQTRKVWRGRKNPQLRTVINLPEHNRVVLACSEECARAADVKLTLSR